MPLRVSWESDTLWVGDRAYACSHSELTGLERQLRGELEINRWSIAAITSVGMKLYRWIHKGDGTTLISREVQTGLEISASQAHLSHLPWEMLHDGNRFLATAASFRVARRLPSTNSGAVPATMTVVYCGVAPAFTRSLDHEREEDALLKLFEHDVFVEVEGTGTLEGIGSSSEDAAVIHISCHGRSTPPALLFPRTVGDPRFVSPEAFVAALASHPQLILLTACESAAFDELNGQSFAGELVARNLPCVLGFGAPIDDSEAIEIACSLYRRMADGLSILDAVETVRRERATRTSDPRGWSTMRLWSLENADQATPLSKRQLPQMVERPSRRYYLVGRRNERTLLLRALSNNDQIGAIIVGRPGIGKTLLALSALERLDREVVHCTGPNDLERVRDRLTDRALQQATVLVDLQELTSAVVGDLVSLSTTLYCTIVVTCRYIDSAADIFAFTVIELGEISESDAHRLIVRTLGGLGDSLPSVMARARLVRMTRHPGLLVHYAPDLVKTSTSTSLRSFESYLLTGNVELPDVVAVLQMVGMPLMRNASPIEFDLLRALEWLHFPMSEERAAAVAGCPDEAIATLVRKGFLDRANRRISIPALLRPQLPRHGPDRLAEAQRRFLAEFMNDSKWTEVESELLFDLCLQFDAGRDMASRVARSHSTWLLHHNRLSEIRNKTEQIESLNPDQRTLLILARAWSDASYVRTAELVNRIWLTDPGLETDDFFLLLGLEVRILYDVGRCEEAFQKATQAVALLETQPSMIGRHGQNMILLGVRSLYALNRPQEARELLKPMLRMLRKSGVHDELWETLVDMYVHDPQLVPDIRATIGSYMAQARQRGHRSEYLAGQMWIAMEVLDQDPRAAVKIAADALALGGPDLDPRLRLDLLVGLAAFETCADLHDRARLHLTEATTLAKQLGIRKYEHLVQVLAEPHDRSRPPGPRMVRRFGRQRATLLARLLGIPFFGILFTILYIATYLIPFDLMPSVRVLLAVLVSVIIQKPVIMPVLGKIVALLFFRKIE